VPLAMTVLPAQSNPNKFFRSQRWAETNIQTQCLIFRISVFTISRHRIEVDNKIHLRVHLIPGDYYETIACLPTCAVVDDYGNRLG
jgi:hypothetical protein